MQHIHTIVKTYIKTLNKEEPFHTDYEYSVSEEPIEFLEYWYFDFLIIPKQGVLSNKNRAFGGAAGFIISKETLHVTHISWSEKTFLEEQALERLTIKERLFQINASNWSPVLIKKLMGMKSAQAINFQKKYKHVDLSNEKALLTVIKAIEDLKKANLG